MASNNRVPDWILERLAHGDLRADERADVQRRVEADETAAARLADIERSDHALRGSLPPFRRIEARAAQARPRREWNFRILLPSLAVAAFAAFVVFRGGVDAPRQSSLGGSPEGEETTRIKGSARLLVHRQQGQSSEPVSASSALAPGDVLQISYLAEAKTYGVIVSIDGRGAVTLHYPESPAGSTELSPKATLPSAYKLDDAPQFERFVFVTGKEPLAVDRVLEAAKAVAADPTLAREGKLPLPAELSQSSLIVRKISP